MQVKLWTGFKKKKGSTAHPTTGGTVKTCVLKDATNVVRPTIILQGHGYFNVTYAQITDFGRYYRVNNITAVGPDTEISLVSDAMATFKSDIVGHFQYVDRASSGPLLTLADPLNPPRGDSYTATTTIGSLSSLVDPSAAGYTPYYVIGICSEDGVQYYGLSYAELSALYSQVFNDSDIIGQVTNQFYGLKDCIISLKKTPFIPVGDPNQPIKIGSKTVTGVTGTLLNSYPISNVMANAVALAFPSVTIGGLTGVNYLDFAPYSDGVINLPFVGLVPLDLDIFGDEREIGVDYYIDQATTDIVYRVKTSGGKIVATYAGQAGADMPFATQSTNPIGALGGVIQTMGGVGALISGNPLGIAQTASGVSQTYSAMQRHTQTNGGLSSMVSTYLTLDIFAEIRTRQPITWDLEEMRDTNGILVRRSQGLNDLSGFCRCVDAKVYCSAFEEERAEIENYMNTGFFIE